MHSASRFRARLAIEIAIEVVGGYFAKQLLPIPLAGPLQHEAETGLEIRRSVLGDLIVTLGLIEIDYDASHSLLWMCVQMSRGVVTRVARLATAHAREISGLSVNCACGRWFSHNCREEQNRKHLHRFGRSYINRFVTPILARRGGVRNLPCAGTSPP